MQTACKKFIREAVDEQCHKTIKEPIHQCNRRTILNFIEHLTCHCSAVTQPKIMDNETEMMKAWDPNVPFETLIMQIEEGQQFASSAGVPFTKNQIITKAYTLIHRTGLHFDACDNWNKKTPAEQTWENFKTHFSTEVLKENKKQKAMQLAGFSANSTLTEQISELTNFISNCVTNNEKKTSLIDNLKNIIEKQTEEIRKLKIESNDFKQQIESLKNRAHGNNNHYNRNQSDSCIDGTHHCWTHGYTAGHWHTSKNCCNKNKGHKDDATATNNTGGSQANKLHD